jgi:hypothetical protein
MFGRKICNQKFFGCFGRYASARPGACPLVDSQGDKACQLRFAYFIDLTKHQEITKNGACFLFIFLPRKEKYQEGAGRVPARSVWNLLSLKAIGWGPPTIQREKKTHVQK